MVDGPYPGRCPGLLHFQTFSLKGITSIHLGRRPNSATAQGSALGKNTDLYAA
jgi:hypothetical protein